MITVKEQFDRVYAECGRPERDLEQNALESACFRDAVKRLCPEDQTEIRTLANRLMTQKPPIRNFGETSAYELLAKLGMFYNGQKTS